MAGYYLCNKRHCDRFGKEIPPDEVSDVNYPKCPGTTQSGDSCGGDLEFHKKSSPIIKILIAVTVTFVIAIPIWFLTKAPDSPDDPVSPNSTPGTTSTPHPGNVTPPIDPPKDPWWVYQQLETSSNILRTEP
ncbi:MAG: hypothetical protein D3916_10765 [Candidatus Electrothrix sp. MAN1_4]|nr:hypothetical protein [Candidatus Electrothrix sp. MAN1_4]